MTSPLISAADLRDRLSEVTVLDVRYRTGGPAGAEEYAAGHVPGRGLRRPRHRPWPRRRATAAGGRHPLPDPQVVRGGDAAGRGVRTTVRSWSTTTGAATPRAGAGGCCGTTATPTCGSWTAGGRLAGGRRRRSRPGPSRPRSPATSQPVRVPMPVVEADDVLDVPVLVDARAPERYRGEHRADRPGGRPHPGCGQRADERQPRPSTAGSAIAAQLRELYAAAGVPLDGRHEVAVYCGSGVTAVHDLLALELLGVRPRSTRAPGRAGSADPPVRSPAG